MNTAKDRLVVFVHIPKTAGTSLRGIIERNFDARAVFTIDGKDPRKSISLFNGLRLEEKASFSLIQGHAEFGAFTDLPHRQVKYITFVRDPVERVLSYYSYILSDSFRRPQAKVAERMPLKEYLSSRYDWQIDNHQTRMIAGNVPPEYGACDEQALERAKMNLIDHFHFVGIAERFDWSILKMSRSLGWKTPFYKKLNVTKKRITRENISEEERGLILGENRYDSQLYEFILALFGYTRPQGLFDLQVKAFQVINRFTA